LDWLPAGLPPFATAGSVKDDSRHLHGNIYPTLSVAYFRDIQYLYKIIYFKGVDLIFTGKWLLWIIGDRDACHRI